MAHSSMIFSGTSHVHLAKAVARNLHVKLGECLIEAFPDGEVGVQILENVRGKDTFVIQSPAINPNHFLMELLIFIDALKRASAKSITAVLPYFAYARQDRKDKGRVPITARLVADLLEKAGVSRVLTMDLHTEQIQGFFNIPVDNLYARPLFVEVLKKEKLSGAVIVSPDVGSNKMVRRYAEDLEAVLAIVDKRRVDGRKVETNALIGDVDGKDAIIVDDMCSTGGTLESAAQVCIKHGAKRVFACVTHGLFLEGTKFEGIQKIFTTDSVPEKKKREGVQVISIAPMLAEAIDRIIKDKSISSLFKS